MDVVAHLLLDETRLAAGAEWTNTRGAWQAGLLRNGVVYLVDQAAAQEILPGDAFLVSPRSHAILRASQLSDAAFTGFHFSPGRLVGLMSLAERLALDSLGEAGFSKIVRGTERAAQEFASVLSHEPGARTFLHRCRLLNIMAMFLGTDLPQLSLINPGRSTTLCHFDKVVSRLSDADLMDCSSEQLAQMCGCSVRHFRRVFRKHFHSSIRSKQTELRLQKASELLVETDDPVVKVAAASGYNHFGLFSAAFKKRFGMTPGEWRKHQAAAA